MDIIVNQWQVNGSILCYAMQDNTGYKTTSASLNIYPNPAGNWINIETDIRGKHWIELTAMNGQLLFSIDSVEPMDKIDLSSLVEGVYFISIKSDEKVLTRRVIKIKK